MNGKMFGVARKVEAGGKQFLDHLSPCFINFEQLSFELNYFVFFKTFFVPLWKINKKWNITIYVSEVCVRRPPIHPVQREDKDNEKAETAAFIHQWSPFM